MKLTVDEPSAGNFARYFDGTGDYITISDHNELDIGTSDFTISIWLYPHEDKDDDSDGFVDDDIEDLVKLRKRCRATVVTVGESDQSDWFLPRIEPSDDGVVFELISPKGDWDGVYSVNLLGRHNARNAALAIAVAAEMGLYQEELIQGLKGCRAASMRMQLQTLGGVTVINDAYNSNTNKFAWTIRMETTGMDRLSSLFSVP